MKEWILMTLKIGLKMMTESNRSLKDDMIDLWKKLASIVTRLHLDEMQRKSNYEPEPVVAKDKNGKLVTIRGINVAALTRDKMMGGGYYNAAPTPHHNDIKKK